MVGGRYITCFPDDDSRMLRSFLYKLENLGIVKLSKEKEQKQDWYKYKWELTKKGKDLVDKNEYLQQLWKEENLSEFYQKVITLLKKEE